MAAEGRFLLLLPSVASPAIDHPSGRVIIFFFFYI
jgi:hypothetical protein